MEMIYLNCSFIFFMFIRSIKYIIFYRNMHFYKIFGLLDNVDSMSYYINPTLDVENITEQLMLRSFLE